MGGGEFVRAAAKMAGAGVTGAGRRGASMVPQFEQLIRGTPRPASVAVASSSSLQPAKACVRAGVEAVQKPTREFDDWEFAAFEDELAAEASEPKPRIVFGAVPSFEEAGEATTELKEALDKVYLSSPEASGTNLNASSNSDLETESCLIVEPTPDLSVPKHALQAFRLLKESVQAQTVVTSLVSDQNVWNAVMENEMVKSFMQSHQTNVIHVADKEFESQKLPEELDDAPDATDPRNSGNIISNALQHIKSSINSVAGTVANMVANASRFFQKIFGSSAAEVSGDDKATSGFSPPEKIMERSIMGLVVLAVMVLVLKRN